MFELTKSLIAMPIFLKKGQVFLSRNNFHLYANSIPQRKGFKAEPSPHVQTPGPCNGQRRPTSSPDQIITRIIEGARQGDTVDMIAYIMLFNSMRVGEVLQIDTKSIDQMGRFKIVSQKGSVGRIGQPGLLVDYFLQKRNQGGWLFEEWNRRTLHYQFDKRGYFVMPAKSSKRAVTHSMRHLSARIAELSGYETETIQSELGHKSKSSTEHYTGSNT